MRVLVTGSNGLLGTKLLGLLRPLAGVEVWGTSRNPCATDYLGTVPFIRADLTDVDAVAYVFDRARPDAVIHTAAMTDVDGCEREPERAHRENVGATAHVARSAARLGAHLVHLSTEYVFDGTAGPYGEDDLPNPLGVYGRSKLESEQVALGLQPDTVIARTTVLFGAAPNVRPNFVTGLVERLRRGERMRIVTDQVGSPTLADNLAEMTWALARDREVRGIFNTVGATVVDRFAFAQAVAVAFSLDGSLLEPIRTDSLRQLARRPLRAGLRMDRFQARYPQVPVLTVGEALAVLRGQVARSLQPMTPEGSRE